MKETIIESMRVRAERVARVAAARREGKSLRAIAAAEGISDVQVRRDLKAAMAAAPSDATAAVKVVGRDGCVYPATRPPMSDEERRRRSVAANRRLAEKLRSLIGKPYDRLTIVEVLGCRNGRRQVLVECNCEAKTRKVVCLEYLEKKRIRSCRCLHVDINLGIVPPEKVDATCERCSGTFATSTSRPSPLCPECRRIVEAADREEEWRRLVAAAPLITQYVSRPNGNPNQEEAEWTT